MKTIKKIACFTVVTLTVIACTSNLEDLNGTFESETNIQQFSTRSTLNNLTIVYHGKTYETSYMMADDSTYLLLNSEVDQLVGDLEDTKPNLMTFYHANGNIEYFDNEEDFSNNKERLYTEHCKEEKISFVLPREGWFPDDNKPYLAPYDPINNEVEIYLYEDEYYRGDMFGLRRTPHDKDYFEVSKFWNFGGGITSMIVHTINKAGLFYFYERMECQGKCFSVFINLDQSINLCSASPTGINPGTDFRFGSIFMLDLKKLYVQGTAGNWSDRICCIKVERFIGGSGIF